jgi:acetyl-CoA carboxylase carboxyl transferase subunit alpha
MGIVDATIPEPLGGAHRNPEVMAKRIRGHLVAELQKLRAMEPEDMLESRYERLLAYGN